TTVSGIGNPGEPGDVSTPEMPANAPRDSRRPAARVPRARRSRFMIRTQRGGEVPGEQKHRRPQAGDVGAPAELRGPAERRERFTEARFRGEPAGLREQGAALVLDREEQRQVRLAP